MMTRMLGLSAARAVPPKSSAVRVAITIIVLVLMVLVLMFLVLMFLVLIVSACATLI
jgi:hypothetical protein